MSTVTYHKRVNGNDLLSNASEYVDFLKNLPDQNVRWVLDWTNCVKHILCTKASEFIPLLGTQGIMAYDPKRFLRQLGRIQELPYKFDLTVFTIVFYKGMCPSEILIKIPIIETYGTLSDDKHVKYIPELKQKGLVTPQYEGWFKGFGTQESQDEPSEEVKRLMAIIEAKDKENLQLKEIVKASKE